MLPIFNEYSSMLQDFGIELPYPPNKLWVDRLISCYFDIITKFIYIYIYIYL